MEKRTSIAGKSKTISIHVSSPGDGEVPPFVCAFPPCINLEGSNQPLRVSAYRNKDSRKKDDYVFVVETPGVDYIGRSINLESRLRHVNQYALGALDSTNGIMKISPVAGNRVIRMEARVHGVDYAESELFSLENQNVEETENAARQERLIEAFGGAKSQRLARKRLREDVFDASLTQSNVLADIVQGAANAKGMLVSQEISERLNASIQHNIPPHDLTATSAELAYPLDQLIANEDLDLISTGRFFHAAKSPEDDKSVLLKQRKGVWFANRLHRLCEKGDEEGNEKRAMIMAYLSYLLDFYHASPVLNPRKIEERTTEDKDKDKDENATISENGLSLASNAESDLLVVAKSFRMPSQIALRLVRTFTYKEVENQVGKEVVFKRTPKLNRLLVSHIAVLSLHFDGFKSDPADLMLALKMDFKKMATVYKELGCVIKKTRKDSKSEPRAGSGSGSEAAQYLVTLPLPLKLPTVDLNRRR